MKHRLMDIQLILTRSGLLLAVYFVIVGVPLALASWGESWLRVLLGERWWLVPVGLSTALATAGPFIYAALRRRADRMLLHELAKKELQVTFDSLTGLLGRSAFLHQARQALVMDQGGGQPSCFLMIDLDWFKQVNDTHGHLVGDVVLQRVAVRLAAELRQRDLLGRFGGEEFVCFLPTTTREQGQAIAEHLRELIASEPIRRSDVAVHQTLSIGLACAPEDGTTLETLIERADTALYAAKRAGRDRVVVTDSTNGSPLP